MAAGKSSRINPKYRIRNWREYERGLRSCGDVTIWLSEDAIAAWIPPKNGLRGPEKLLGTDQARHGVRRRWTTPDKWVAIVFVIERSRRIV